MTWVIGIPAPGFAVMTADVRVSQDDEPILDWA
jgi:hypothetical protein